MTYALVDCNNFYVSCERVFNPALAGRMVVVLSNNDGCIVARSNEAKAAGIPMGAPYHQWRQLLEKNNAAVFSSNYQFYGDMSQRVMGSLAMFAPHMEVYSIDEAFLQLDVCAPENLPDFARDSRQRILQWTGIPTSFGLAPTKTLAKIANHMAKKYSEDGVFDMRCPKVQGAVMGHLPVEEIWGISSRRGQRLRQLGIETAWQLRQADPRYIRQHFSVVEERMVLELRGQPCLALEAPAPRKNIMSSKSFGQLVMDLPSLKQALANYAARACEKLRAQHSKTQGVYVFITTNKHRKQDKQYRASLAWGFDSPTASTAEVIGLATGLLERLYRPGYKYKKVGLMLLDTVPDSHHQGDLFTPPPSRKNHQLMAVMDELNSAMGQDTVFHLAQGTAKKTANGPQWQMRRDKRSPCYTTKWTELPEAS